MNSTLIAQPLPTRTRLEKWFSILDEASNHASTESHNGGWIEVSVPHNWEDYHGYHAVSHGNLHTTAWYRTSFHYQSSEAERLYAFFEGVGSYATVYANGVEVGSHTGGRTTFTVDLTEALVDGSNVLTVKADHPEGIDDLPFVCGGCWGAPNTEGSQPLGIFRPVWLERTGPIRVAPFGVHVLTPLVSNHAARVQTHTTLSNPNAKQYHVCLHQEVIDAAGHIVCEAKTHSKIDGRDEILITQSFPELRSPQLWSPSAPNLYKMHSTLLVDDQVSHKTTTTFGLRTIEWPQIDNPQADHNVVSADKRGAMICNGNIQRTPDNNGLTSIEVSTPDAPVRLVPMGVTIYQLPQSTASCAHIEVEVVLECVTNADSRQDVVLLCEIQNEGGTVFFHQHRANLQLSAQGLVHSWNVPPIHHPHCWSPENPYLHRVLIEARSPDGKLWERSETLCGFRSEDCDNKRVLNLARPKFERKADTNKSQPSALSNSRTLKINGEPVFLNGTCGYEVLLGADHAYSDEQIEADVAIMRSAGFNAFRDAHHPHNLRYYDHWDRHGIVCWTQMGSRVWFDNERFRENYRQLVREWVKERRNHPSIIIWGIQNESALPEAFTAELCQIIRELDPTSPQWRITATCNGGKGADWNVPQEWSGTYGGSFHDYDLETCQLVGEYGAWRSFGVHTEHKYAGNENDRSESWACAAMEAKIAHAESVKKNAIGHFHWVFHSFPNPGRSADNYEGPDNAQIGSINNKGLVTAWHQPSDLYHLYRANYVSPAKDPMVYLVSHTWPERWADNDRHSVCIFSNCDEVELFNGIERHSYGRLKNPGRGQHFIWPDILPKTNLLHAVGWYRGKAVAQDLLRLNSLPEDESLATWVGQADKSEASAPHALFRVNCGGESFKDVYGKHWEGDKPWRPDCNCGWQSWGNLYENVPDDIASRGFSMTPVRGTALQPLHQTYRFGRSYLKYHFRTGAGRFLVRCHFAEPWFGIGGITNARGWRLFDIAINNTTVEKDLDIWSQTEGAHNACTRTYTVSITEPILTLHFPRVTVNQALICGIEIIPT